MISTLTQLRYRFLIFVFTILSYEFASAQTPTPFDCSTGLGYILTNVNPGGGNITSLHSFNLSDGTDVVIQADILPAPDRFLNAFGYNPVDNFLYGFRYGTNQIVKVGSNGAIEILTVSGLNSSGQYATGDVSPAGFLYLYGTIGGSGSVIAIDLNPASGNYLVAQSQTVTGINLLGDLNDWAFNPVDGFIYGMATDHSLIQYNPTTNVVTSLGVATGLSGETGAFGTAFMDNEGGAYVGNNASGNIYKIAKRVNEGDPLVASLFSNSLAGKSPGDGARCASQPVPPSANLNTACVDEGSTVPILINVAQNDGEGTFPLDLSTVVLIDPITDAEVSTVTIPEQGTFNVVGAGIISFTPDPGFSVADVKYKISDTESLQSGEANVLVSICGLPVKLSGISAKSVEQDIALEWKTTSEINFDHFEVQRSKVSASNFEAVTAIKSQIAGSTYGYRDVSVMPNTNYYYRLKMIDIDGTYAYSKIVSARWNKERELVMAPNPGQGFVLVTCDEPVVKYQLYNTSGRELSSDAGENSTRITLDLRDVRQGNYILKLTFEGGGSETKNLIVE